MGGGFAEHGDTITVGQIAATLMGCSEPAATFESAGFAILDQPMRWQWRADSALVLTNSAGSIALARAAQPGLRSGVLRKLSKAADRW